MSYLDEMVARSIAEERRRDTLLELRRQAAAQPSRTPATVVAPRDHHRWHDALVRLHLLHTTPVS